MDNTSQAQANATTQSTGCPFSDSSQIPPFPRPRQRVFDPPLEYSGLRDDRSVFRVRLWNGDIAWVITRHEDYKTVLGDPRFSADPTTPGFPGQSAALQASRKKYPSFVSMDPPKHTAQRRMVTGEFAARRIGQMRSKLQKIVDDLIDAMIEKGPPADLVECFALAVPSSVICELMGIPYSDHEFFQSRTRIFTSNAVSMEAALAANRELVDEYLAGLLKRKNEDPQDDLLSRLVVDHVRTGHLTEHEVVSMARMLLIAGHETTANMIALGTLLFLQHPDQLELLRGDPGLTPAAVEEIMRYLSIAHSGQRRVAKEDVEISGQLIRAGEGIIAFQSAANRDGKVFSDPDKFDIRRDARQQVGFGFGVHGCLGQYLARVELQIVFTTLFNRLPNLALAAPIEKLKFKDDMLVYGVEHVPVTW
jgi:cytochrome P450